MIDLVSTVHTVSTLITDPSVWFAIAFGIFCIVFGKKLVSFILSIADTYIDSLKAQLSQSLQNKNVMLASRNEAIEQCAKAEKTAADIISHATKEAKILKSKSEQDLDKFLQDREKACDAYVKLAEDKVYKQMLTQAIVTSITVTQKLLMQHVSAQQDRVFVDEAINMLEKCDLQ